MKRWRIGLVIIFGILFGAIHPRQMYASNENIKTGGDVGQYIPTATALLLIVKNADFEGLKQFSLASASGAAVAYSLKYGLDVQRPNGGHNSMPSGHAWFAFNGAEFVRKRYGWTWGIPLYMVAGFTGYSRVAVNAHRPQDIVAAGGIALVTNYFFTDRFEKNNIALAPFTTHNAAGLMLSFCW